MRSEEGDSGSYTVLVLCRERHNQKDPNMIGTMCAVLACCHVSRTTSEPGYVTAS
jgi:hypothetical protein